MNITLVKKIKLDGNPCHRSANVLEHLEKLGLLERIDKIIAADEREQYSEGFVLALKHKVEVAPFFIINNADGSSRVYKAYYHFLKEIFHQEVSESEEISEIMSQHSDLDFI
ncbi:hypothetical protein [Nostoc sp. ATCC 53789]|uniref:hypothetical protein n=1 Tax=Nostoc sp. ATCC 53789 TaxID=76335 RepID=UPI000DECB038|nr:hypothetical protein [Nostoc sp. ATCC 53789]QHG21100.1 hypothetical protein GJB62_35190 [Nostoc sp. ATCC 53789]RCJ17026.1 hypothetical protein A6V25_29740 [Nostoc sp. ATCC 53789]